MIEPPQISELAAQVTAVIRMRVPRSEIRMVMGPGLKELFAVIAAQGVAPIGQWFTHHFRMNPDVFDFEIGVPVAGKVEVSGRVEASEWPAMRVARTVFHGSYEELSGAWSQFGRWIGDQGLEGAPDLWELYPVGPDASRDPAAWRTELIRPLIN